MAARYTDLRDFIAKLEDSGQLVRIPPKLTLTSR